jgi:hypothetical protein
MVQNDARKIARIKEAQNGSIHVSYPGGKFAVIEQWDDLHDRLRDVLAEVETHAVPSPQMAEANAAKEELESAKFAVHEAHVRLAKAERALQTARTLQREARRADV